MEDRYKLLSAPEIAGEDSFIRWVMHGENDLQWTQWKQEFPDQAETLDEARHIVQMISVRSAPSMNADVKKQLWNSIQSDISGKKRNFKRRSLIIRWSIAAAAVIGILFWYNASSGIQNIIVDPGVTADITLPESSVVTVNAGSTIRYNEKHFTAERKIRMEGEAFFKVSPGSKFTVITPQGTVTVVGTSFNVIARPGRFEVSCFTGKVRVEQDPNDKVEIVSGQGCYASGMKEKLQLKTFDPSTSTPDWTRGKFTFENLPLSMVVSELERQYGVRVKLSPEIKDLKYIGFFESGDLEVAVKLITWPLHLHAQISDKTVTISR
ncbi:MAG TPA: FecR domain-containing protein [Saprospiraceae bacterium]|nr:FecR domain-containing protein [Saprospiraceae bacterium]